MAVVKHQKMFLRFTGNITRFSNLPAYLKIFIDAVVYICMPPIFVRLMSVPVRTVKKAFFFLRSEEYSTGRRGRTYMNGKLYGRKQR